MVFINFQKMAKAKEKKRKKKDKDGNAVQCQTFTVVSGLKKVLNAGKNGKRVLQKIKELVEAVSKSIKLGSFHLHFRLYDLILNGNRADIKNEFARKFIDSKYFSQMKKTGLAAKYPIQPGFLGYFDNYDIEIPTIQYGTQCHTYSVQEYVKNFQTNIHLHAEVRVKKFFKTETNDEDAIRRTLRYLFHNDIEGPHFKPVEPDYRLLYHYHLEIRPLLTRAERERELVNQDDDNVMPRGWFLTLKDKEQW